MTTNAVNLAKLLGPSATIPAESLSSDISFGPEEYASAASLPGTAGVGDQVFVTETNRLYIWTGQGWYNIALINQTPTWDSGGQPDGSYVLATDGSPTTITLLATDPDGLPVSYTATGDSGFDAIATVLDSDNVFTITPKFTIDDDSAIGGNGSITFRATDGVNYASALSSFTINFVTSIENSKYTSALITSVGSNGGTNSTVTDASTNGHTITVNGDASSQTFSPYRSGGYSYYFDGTGDYISTTSNLTDFHVGTGDFTIEAWIWKSANGQNGYDGLFSLGTNGNATDGIFMEASSSRGIFVYCNGTQVVQDTDSVNTSTWIHIALSRSSGTTRLFRDGTLVDSTTTSYAVPTTGTSFSIGKVGSLPYYFNGYIRDFRFVKGTAVYTSEFTPPTEPLEAITNTTMLTCHLPYLKDASSNNHSITVNGNVSAKPFGPYDYDEYDSATHGGCLEVANNAGDNITFSPGSSTSFGTGDFTVECWFYRTSIPSDSYNDLIISNRSSAASNPSGSFGLLIENDGDDQFGWQWTTGSTNNLRGGKCELNNWYHIAAVRNGTTLTLYVNGKSVNSVTNSDSMGSTSTVSIGGMVNGELRAPGYVSDVRIVKGTAVYTSDFTPPTEPLTAITNTSLLISGTDASIVDKAQSTQLTLVGDTQSSTSQTKYGSSSMYFDGSGDEILISNFTPLGTDDFTIEFWMNPTTTGQDGGILSDGNGNNLIVYWNGTLYANEYGTSITAAVSANTWTHVAFVRTNGGIELFINGTSSATASSTNNLSIANLIVGRYTYNGTLYRHSGYLEDFRITRGLARYTANFTPPTASLEG